MPAPISVIIPTLNSARHLAPTLVCVFNGVQAGLVREVIFADGGSNDDTARIATEAGAQLITTKPGRGLQLACAIEQARGDWFLVLHSDTQLAQDWPDVIARHLVKPDTAAYFKLAFADKSWAAKWVAAWGNLRARLFDLPFGDQGLLISRRLYIESGGYAEIPLMEDMALSRSLRGKLIQLPVAATTDAEKYQQQGWLRRGARNLKLQILFLLGRDPQILAHQYRSQSK